MFPESLVKMKNEGETYIFKFLVSFYIMRKLTVKHFRLISLYPKLCTLNYSI